MRDKHTPGVSRRTLLAGTAIAVFSGWACDGPVAVAVDGHGLLTDKQLRTLRAVVDRIVPGRPEDLAEGARYARCAEAIDGLLAAFTTDPPRIYAGAPFSDRAGSPTNDFAEFLALDEYEERAWRLRIEGSRGRPELEFNGPVPGLQSVYRDGLDALDKAAGPVGFAALPGAARDLLLRTTQDETVLRMLDAAVGHTMEFFYGAPEYGGNRDLVSWKFTGYAGDVQPRGWTDDEVTEPDGPMPAKLPPLPAGINVDKLLALAPLAAPEVAAGAIQRNGGSFRELQRHIKSIVDGQHGR